MKCKICNSETTNCFDSKILGKHLVEYHKCEVCCFLQTEEPYWLDEAYKKPINTSDTGYISRNLLISKKLTFLLYFVFDKNGKYLDYAAGYGVLVRMMRDIGFNFYWEDKYTDNLFSKGFEWNKDDSLQAVTAFEVFEHFVNPIKEIENLLGISDTIIFTTELYPKHNPSPEEWWYFGLDHGQHISFYSHETLEYIAKKYDLRFYSDGFIHILTRNHISSTKIKLSRLSNYGVCKVISRFLMTSRTFADHQQIVR